MGTVTGTGTYQNTPVIFVNDQMYPLNSIMAVGTLPQVPDTGDGDGTQTGGDTQTGEGDSQAGAEAAQAL